MRFVFRSAFFALSATFALVAACGTDDAAPIDPTGTGTALAPDAGAGAADGGGDDGAVNLVLPRTSPEAGASAFAWDEGPTPSADFLAAGREILASCRQAAAALDAVEAPAEFSVEGRPSSDPGRATSDAITSVLRDTIPNLGYCARFDHAERAVGRDAIVRYARRLDGVYIGGSNRNPDAGNDDPGNPINEFQLYPLILGADMIWQGLGPADRDILVKLFRGIDTRVTAFVAQLTPTDGRRSNAWMAYALMLRASIALVTGNTAAAQALVDEFTMLSARMYEQASTGIATSPCSADAGTGFISREFQQRDSLAAHLSLTGVVVRFAAFRPGFLTDATLGQLEAAMMELQPYVAGEKTHREFVCSSLSFDRSQATLNQPWDPLRDRQPVRFARLVFPAIRPWTAAYVTTTQPAWIRVFAGGKGD